jgi:putative phosphoesterase
MMKVLVISDTHGLEHELLKVKEKLESEVDLMIHCGDSELSIDHEALKGFLVVKGNCDLDNGFPDDVIQQLNEEVQLYATHGHLYNVKMTLMNIQYRAEEMGAKIICFGHSHLAGSELTFDRLFINPGSFRLPRRIAERTYCIIELVGRSVNVEFFNHEHKRVDELCSNYSI